MTEQPNAVTGPVAAVTVMPPQPVNPFARQQAEHISAGTVAIESERAIAEAQGKLVIAKRFPRDQFSAFERVMDACRRPGLANTAFYSYPRGGKTVSGPSIRLAEELARCWGNVDYGLRELSQREGESEMEAYAWDLETNTMSSQKFTVKHIRDRNEGGARVLTDQRDIYEMTANMGARRLRARILAILPDDVVESAVQECRRTLSGKNDEPITERVKRVVAAFGTVGVRAAQIESYLTHGLDTITPEEIADLQGIYNSLKEGVSKVADWFGAPAVAGPTGEVAPRAAQSAAPSAPKMPAQTGDGARPPSNRGRPSKEDLDSARESGNNAYRLGVAIDQVPDEFKAPSLARAWKESWQAAKDADETAAADKAKAAAVAAPVTAPTTVAAPQQAAPVAAKEPLTDIPPHLIRDDQNRLPGDPNYTGTGKPLPSTTGPASVPFAPPPAPAAAVTAAPSAAEPGDDDGFSFGDE